MAVYITGTVTVTNSSAIVTGAGTGFVAAGIAEGAIFTVRDSGIPYTVAKINSATQLQLSAPYAGASGSGKSYTIVSNFTSRLGLPLMSPGDVDTATIYSRAMALIDAALGSAQKGPVRMATTAALPANSRASGLTLVADAVGAITAIDGITPVLGDRILVKNESDASKNGIYTWTDLGDTSASWELTRATDADTDGEVTANVEVPVEEGTANADTTWVLTTNNPITLDVTSLSFSEITDASIKVPMVLSPGGLKPTLTAGCGGPSARETTTNKNNYYTVDFDDTTEENAWTEVEMPDNYDGGSFYARARWESAAGTVGQTIALGIKMAAYVDGDANDSAWGTEVNLTDTLAAVNKYQETAESTAITPSGTPIGGCKIAINLARKVAADNLTGDLRLRGVVLEYSINRVST